MVARFFILVFLFSPGASAYHHFIGYGYSSCMTCHYNGAGGGALTDYGRGLFATEIAGRWFVPKSVSEDRLAETSSFLGFKELPFWIRPALKYRALSLETNPGSESKTKRWIPMQREAYLTLSADQDGKYIFVGSLTQNDEPRLFSTGPESRQEPGWFAKEAYFRIQLNDSSWVYLGQMDKVFGIREINHTAFSRQKIGMTQYDQSVGGIYQRTKEKHELFLGAFQGNASERPEARFKGFSSLYEYEPFEKMRVGFSLLSEKNESTEKRALALHERYGFRRGSALSAEFGVVEDKNLKIDVPVPQVGYVMLQSLVLLDRGVNFLGEIETFRSDMKTGSPQVWRWGLGFLIFPLQRFEWRASAVNYRIFSNSSGNQETWALQNQLHISL